MNRYCLSVSLIITTVVRNWFLVNKNFYEKILNLHGIFNTLLFGGHRSIWYHQAMKHSLQQGKGFGVISLTLSNWLFYSEKQDAKRNFERKKMLLFKNPSLILLILIIMWGFSLNTFYYLHLGGEIVPRNHWLSGSMPRTKAVFLRLMTLLGISWEQLILLILKKQVQH